MEKVIKIGDKDIKMKASAYSPVIYRECFGGDLIGDAQRSFDGSRVTDSEVIGRMAYAFAKEADDGIGTYKDFLSELNYLDLCKATEEILNLWLYETKTTSSQKK